MSDSIILPVNKKHTAIFAKHRINISRLFFLGLVAIAMTARPMASNHAWLLECMSAIGFLAVVVASLGRLWCSLYLCGYKNNTVVNSGPFSVVRNPLYLFTFLGALGIGLSTGSMLIVLLFVLFFLVLYPPVIKNEEKNLVAALGESYVNYQKVTPRLIPDFTLYSHAPQYLINMKSVHAAFKDVIWFYVAWFLAQWIPAMHISGSLPNLFVIF